MTLERAWGLVKAMNAPTPAPVVMAKRIYRDGRAVCGLLCEILPDPAANDQGRSRASLEREHDDFTE